MEFPAARAAGEEVLASSTNVTPTQLHVASSTDTVTVQVGLNGLNFPCRELTTASFKRAVQIVRFGSLSVDPPPWGEARNHPIIAAMSCKEFFFFGKS